MLLFLSLAYLLSGFCALVYETVWIFRFSRIFGSSVIAMGCVVAVFFGGLAIGSRIFGKAASRNSNPLRLYARLELCIGAYALAFPWIVAFADGIYGRIFPSISESQVLIAFAQIVLALTVLVVPTALMGGTLPVLLAHCADRLSWLGRRAGFVYGINALGAALGSLLTGYWLLKQFGLAWTNALAALLNLSIGLLAWMLSRRANHAPQSEMGAPQLLSEAPPGASCSPGVVRLVVVCFAVSGFIGMSYEAIWLRYYTLYFTDTIYLYSGIIAVFVLGTGLGSLAFGPWASKTRAPVAILGLLQAGIGLAAIESIHAPVPYFQPVFSAGAASAANVLWILLALLFLPTFLMGATFPMVARIVVADIRETGFRMGRVYAWNTLGCVAGLLGSTFVLPGVFGLQGTLYLLLGFNALMAAVLLASGLSLRRAAMAVAVLIAFGAANLTLRHGGMKLPESVLREPLRENERLLEVQEGPLGITWATGDASGKTVYLWDNGARIGRGGRSTSSVQGFIPMLIAPNIPRDVLGLAFGAGLSSRAARAFPEVRRMDFVDISRENIDVALRQIPENAGLREDPRANFIVDDAYGYVKHRAGRYDLILMEPTPPRYSYRCADLYTQEFYDHVQARLAEGGLFAQVLALGDLSPEETRGIMRTFSSVFEHCLLWKNGGDCVMLGGRQAFRIDAEAVAARLGRPEIQRAMRESAPAGERPYTIEGFLAGILLTERDFKEAAEGGERYTDDRSALKFTTGREVTTANIRAIHAHLTPWAKIVPLVDGYSNLEKTLPLLAMEREFSMALLYKQQPREFYEVFMAYIEKYSLAKDADRALLRKYLLDRGMAAEAEKLDVKTETLPKP